MIGYLKGKILNISGQELIINVNDVGYIVNVGNQLLTKYSVNDEIELFTYQHVKEDILCLYGFLKKENVEIFKKLLSVSGIGPKSALNILSIISINDLFSAIANNDPEILTQVSGVGKKTAERVVLELNSQLDTLTWAHIDIQDPVLNNRDVIDALVELGYPLHQVRKAVRIIPSEIKELSDQIKFCLKNIK